MQKNFHRMTGVLLCLLLLLCPLLASCAHGTDGETADTLTLTVNPKNNVVTAKITLSPATIQNHPGASLVLWELAPGETVASLSGKEPLHTGRVTAGGTSVRFPLLPEGGVSRLYSTFVVGFDDGTILPATRTGISDPERFADASAPFLWRNDPKGLAVGSVDDAAALGCAHAMFSLRLSEIPADGSVSTSVRLSSLRRTVEDAARAGMQVSLSLIPDRLPDRNAAALIDGLCGFLAGGENGVTALYLDGRSLSAADAAELLRVSYYALRSRNAEGQVFLIRSGNAQSLTEFFGKVAGLLPQNHFSWGAAVTLPNVTITPWNDQNGDTLCVSGLSGLFSALRETDGLAPSAFALCDLCFPADDENAQAAAYLYTYRAAVLAGASFVYYGAHNDSAAGLRSNVGTARRICTAFAEADAGLSADTLRLCRDAAGAAWTEVADLAPAVKRLSGGVNAGADAGAGQTLLDFTDGDLSAVSPAGTSDTPTLQLSGTFGKQVLHLWLPAGSLNTETGIRAVLPTCGISGDASVLSLRLLAQAPEGEHCTVTLRLRGEDRDGGILLYEASAEALNGYWQTLDFRAASFSAQADPDRPLVVTVLIRPETPAPDLCALWVRDVRVASAGTSESPLIPLALVGACVLLSFFVIFLLYRIAAKKRERVSKNGRKETKCR